MNRTITCAAAADLIRRAGIAEASLADMMAAACLTHGGFYRHFRNKERSVSEALSAVGEKAIATIGPNLAKGSLNAVVDGYLSLSLRFSHAQLPLRRPGKRRIGRRPAVQTGMTAFDDKREAIN
jgi:AcrR family transcriptional regulator